MDSLDSLEAAGDLLNSLQNQDSLEQFLERIVKGLIDSLTTHTIFSEKEINQLVQLFSTSVSDLYNIIDIAIYFFEKFAFSKQSVENAHELLTKAKLTQKIWTAFENIWTQYAESYVNSLKKRRVWVKDGLDYLNWTLNIPLENSHILTDTKMSFVKGEDNPEIRLSKDTKAPFAEMTFCTSSNQSESIYNTKEDKTAKIQTVTFGKMGLQSLFEELEKINSYLDMNAE